MGASFIELAQAVRETHTIGLHTIAQLVGVAGADVLAAMRARKALLYETAELMTEQAPHEVLIRSIVQVGGLAALPEYSADVASARVGDFALVRGRIEEDFPGELRIAFSACRHTSRVYVDRAELKGVALVTPTMWR